MHFFEPNYSQPIEEKMDFDLLKAFLQKTPPISHYFDTLRIDGYFSYNKVHNVPRQKNLYPPQVEVIKTQPIFEFSEIKGTLAGFRFPYYSRLLMYLDTIRTFYLKITSLVGIYWITKLNVDCYQ